MRIAELHTDHQYRSLHLLAAISGKNDARADVVEHDLFSFERPIGCDWIPCEVGYYAGSGNPPEDCCEAEVGIGLPPESSKAFGDFPHFWGINFGVLTKRSYDALHDLIAPHVEFLPLQSEEGDFTAFKVLRFVDSLDHQQSAIEWFPQLKRHKDQPRVASVIKEHAFREELLEQEVIFRVPEMPFGNHVFVTETFINCVNANSLEGFGFRDVWPPTDPSVEREKYLKKRLRKKGRQR